MLAKFISLNAVIRGYICVPFWYALKSVSHSNLLFLATLLRHTSELESKNSASQSQQHTTVYREKKLNHAAKSELSWFLFFFQGRKLAAQAPDHKLFITSGG